MLKGGKGERGKGKEVRVPCRVRVRWRGLKGKGEMLEYEVTTPLYGIILLLHVYISGLPPHLLDSLLD